MDKRFLSQATVAMIAFAFFLASFLQAKTSRTFDRHSGESPDMIRLPPYPARHWKQQTVRL